MLLLLKNCSIAVVTYLLIRFNKTRSILGNKKNADRNGVKEQSRRIQHNISGLVRMKISDNPFFLKKKNRNLPFVGRSRKIKPNSLCKGERGFNYKAPDPKTTKRFRSNFFMPLYVKGCVRYILLVCFVCLNV